MRIERHRVAGLTLVLAAASGSVHAAAGTLTLDRTEATVTESYTYGSYVTVYRTGGTSGTVSVDYTVGGGTATADTDYLPRAGTLRWYGGEKFGQNIDLVPRDDGLVESTETFNVTLSNPTGGAALGTNSAVVSLRDNDGPGPGSIRFALDPLIVYEWGESQILLERVDGKDGAVSANVVSAATESPMTVIISDGGEDVDLSLLGEGGGGACPLALVLFVLLRAPRRSAALAT